MNLLHFLTKHLFILAIAAVIFTGMVSCSKDDNDEDSNQLPTCTISNPGDGEEFNQGDIINISAEAEDEDGSIYEVRFYIDGTSAGSVSEFPYNYKWHTMDTETGSHTIKATAYDNEKDIASDEIEIQLKQGGGNINIEMVTVTGGTFDMGCTSEQSNCGSDETPVHTVTLDDFEISKYEITNQQYADFMNEIGANSDGSYNDTEYLDMDDADCQINYTGGQFIPGSGKENYPVIEVTWYGSNAFCQYYGGRLPTEAEWEFAARGGNSATLTLYAGSDDIDDVAWYNGNSGGSTHEVGKKAPNELDIYDMSGNVWEWCNDWYDSDYYSSSPQNNPQGPSNGSNRVLRGGSWTNYSDVCHLSFRDSGDPDLSLEYDGFRFCRISN